MCEDAKDIEDNDVRDNEKQITKPVKAIRAKCLDCCCNQINEVKECTAINCPLYPFRFGKNPYRTKREFTEEQRAELRERLSKGRKT